MGLFNNVKNKLEERRLNKMEEDLKKISTRGNLSFDPFCVDKLRAITNTKTFSARVLENYVWFVGSIPLLRRYYREQKQLFNEQYGDDDYQFFWGNVRNDCRKVTTMIPSVATEKMKDLIIGNGIEIKCEVFDDNGEVNAGESKKVQEVIDEIYKENKLYHLMSKSIVDESWCGTISWKINIDTSFSKLPIIDEADVRNFELITKHNRVIGISYQTYYNYGKQKYVLKEVYSTDDNDNAIIENKLYRVDNDRLIEVNLSTIPETADLEPLSILKDVKGMIAGFKINKSQSNEFMDSPYGESDYAGCYSLFDSADEIYSTMIDEVRKGRTIRFIPESMIPKNSQGETLPFDNFKMDYVKVNGNDATLNNEENSIITSSPQTRTDEHIAEWKSVLTTILNNIGLSPLTLGVTGLEAVNAGENSQREREKVSLRTRDAKIKLWKEFLEEFTIQLLKVYQYMTSKGEKVNGLEKINVDESKLNIKVNFGDYFKTPFEERLATYGTAHMNGSISIEEMVEQVYRDEKTEDQKKIEINRLKAERGMSLSNIDNLLL